MGDMGTWGVLGHTALGSLGTESSCTGHLSQDVVTHGVLACGDMWDTEGTSHITSRTRSPWLGRTLPWGHGHRAEQWQPPGIMRAPPPVPVCPPVPLSLCPLPALSHPLHLSVLFLSGFCVSCTACGSPHCPICPLYYLPMTILGLAHVLCDKAQGWVGMCHRLCYSPS